MQLFANLDFTNLILKEFSETQNSEMWPEKPIQFFFILHLLYPSVKDI